MEEVHINTPQATPARDPKDVEENKDLAAFSYVWVFSLLVLFTKKGSPFVRFHARQGTALFILSIIFWYVPGIWNLLELIVIFGMVWGFIHAAQGKWDEVPLIGHLVRGKKPPLRSSLKKSVDGTMKGYEHAKKIWKEHKEDQSNLSPEENTGPTL